MKRENSNIIATLDMIFMIGWKYDPAQQKPKSRGTAQFSLKDVVKDLNEKEDDGEGGPKKIRYGVLIDDGDEVKEIEK